MSPLPFPRVRVASFGCVSPLGIGREETRESLQAGRDGISPVRLFPVSGRRCQTAGQVTDELGALARAVSPRSRHWSRAAQMVLLAMEEARQGAPDFVPDCVVMGTTSGGMSLGEDFFRALTSGRSPHAATRRLLGYFPLQPVQQAMRICHWEAPVEIVSNACASGTNALGLACQLLRAGAARRVLAGGYDALTEFVFAGFDSLHASTAEKCRPFDAARSGLVLGEGAAVFCLQAEGSGPVLSGYGSAVDTHHLTQPHPSGSGPLTAMQRALAAATLEPEAIDYINAHGTGTRFNDASEARAILQVCPQTPVSSTKGMTGHALGVAGALEAAFCCEALEGEFLPPNLNFNQTDDEFPLDIVANSARPARPQRILSNSFGFGGANATLVLEGSAS